MKPEACSPGDGPDPEIWVGTCHGIYAIRERELSDFCRGTAYVAVVALTCLAGFEALVCVLR